MTSAVTTGRRAARQLPLWQTLSNDSRVRRDRLRRLIFLHGKGLTADERAALQSERAELAAPVGPVVTADTVGDLVLPIIETFKGRNPDVAADQIAVAYAVALTGLQRYAVAEACQRVLAGKAGLDLHFRPTPAELADLARKIHGTTEIAMRRIDELLGAPIDPPAHVPTAAERQRVAEVLAGDRHREAVQAARPVADGGHHRRVAEDLERRRAEREEPAS